MREFIVEKSDEVAERIVKYSSFYKGEIIRCKDCKYSFQGWHNLLCERPFHEFEIKPDGFCAWAERREE